MSSRSRSKRSSTVKVVKPSAKAVVAVNARPKAARPMQVGVFMLTSPRVSCGIHTLIMCTMLCTYSGRFNDDWA